MADASVPIASRTLKAPSPASTGTPTSTPLGLLATLSWGMAALVALQLTDPLMRMMGIVLPPEVPTHYLAVVAVVAMAMWACRRPFREYLALAPMGWTDVGRGIGYGVLGLIGLVAMYAAFGILPPIVRMPFTTETMQYLLRLWILMVIAAPIAEELLFRGLLYRGLAESQIGVLGAIILSSVLFGLVHYSLGGWPRVVATGCMGLLFAWLRWRSGSTSICLVAHVTANGVGGAILTTLFLLP
jgi:membrane protease YdiL (CAAX protease family)